MLSYPGCSCSIYRSVPLSAYRMVPPTPAFTATTPSSDVRVCPPAAAPPFSRFSASPLPSLLFASPVRASTAAVACVHTRRFSSAFTVSSPSPVTVTVFLLSLISALVVRSATVTAMLPAWLFPEAPAPAIATVLSTWRSFTSSRSNRMFSFPARLSSISLVIAAADSFSSLIASSLMKSTKPLSWIWVITGS